MTKQLRIPGTPATMYALTLWPEWLPAFTHMGKDVENRTWRPPVRLVGQRLALHAGANVGGGSGKRGRQWLERTAWEAGWSVEFGGPKLLSLTCSRRGYGPSTTTEIVLGAIVATARVRDAVQDTPSLWAMEGQWHWLLDDLRVLERPIPARGRQGLWRVPPDVVAQMDDVWAGLV